MLDGRRCALDQGVERRRNENRVAQPRFANDVDRKGDWIGSGVEPREVNEERRPMRLSYR